MKKPEDLSLRVMTFRTPMSPDVCDPVKIHFASQYLFLENIYSPLVEYAPDGELVSGVAESFQWINNEAHFRIRENLITIDGYKITAFDVEKTFKRLFILNTNTHGNLKDMVCGHRKLRSLNDSCPGMEVRENGNVFVLKFSERKPFLFPMLTAIDFGIIPAKSIDSKTLKIIDYRNTSGPYYVASKQGIDLKVNPHHYHYSSRIPQNVLYVYPENKDVFDPIAAFSENKIDHITTVSSTPDVLIPYAKKHSNIINLHSTYPFWLRFIAFTKKGRKRLTVKERLQIGVLIRKSVLPRYLKLSGYEATEQIFPAVGEGGLSKEQVLNLRAKISSIKLSDTISKKMIAWYFPEKDISALKKCFPNTEFINGRGIPGLVDYKKEGIEEPDFYFSGTDMSFQEDINLISYHLNNDFFNVIGPEAKKWIKEYMDILDKTKRIQMLNELHYKTLIEGDVIPLVFCPYTAIVRKPWVFGLSKYYANNPIWRIYQK